MVALTSVFAQDPKLEVTPSSHDFGTKSYFAGEAVNFQGSFDFALDTANLADELEDPVIGTDWDGNVVEAEYVTVEGKAKVRVSYTATKKGEYEDSVFIKAGALADTIVVTLKVEEKALPVINVAASYGFGNVEFADAQKGVQDEIPASVTDGILSVKELKGADADAFEASIGDGELVIKFKPASPEVRPYEATVVLSAPYAEDKEVALSAYVKMPKPVLSVLPESWTETAMLTNGKAKAEKVFDISGLYLFSQPAGAIKGGSNSKFKWVAAEKKVTFEATADGTYEDVLVISADNAESIEVPLKVTVERPVISVSAKTIDFGTISLPDAWQGNVAPKTIEVSINSDAQLSVVVPNGPFSAKIENGQLVVSFKAQAAGAFAAKAVIKAGTDAEEVEIALSAFVQQPEPQLNVQPLEWKETIQMVDNVAKASRAISISALYTLDMPKAVIKGGNNSPFAWDAENSKVTFEVKYRTGTYTDVLVVSATGVESIEIPLEITVNDGGVSPINVTGVTLDKENAELVIGNKLTLIATVAPANADNKGVTWESSDSNVASVANGVVTAIAEGVAVITVKTLDGNFSATCTVTVTNGIVPAAGVTLDQTVAELELGKTITLNANVLPANATNKAVTWISSNPAVATVIEGIVIPSAKGITVITVKTMDGNFVANCVVTVTDGVVPVAGISLNESAAELEVGKVMNLAATIAPANATNKNITWASSNESVATVTNGYVIAVAKGTALITVTTEDGKFTAACIVTVKESAVAVTGVTLSQTSASLQVGKTLSLSANVLPSNAANKTVTWSTSNAAVATVDNNGKVTAVAKGSATITVKTADGNYTATCAVTVTEGSTPPPTPGTSDVITYVETGLKEQASGYKDATITNMPSGAEYMINANAGVEYIQLRTTNNNSGLVTTKSAGSLASITVKFNAATNEARVLNIYASKTAYTSPADLYGEAVYVAQIAYANGAEQTYTFTDDYQYVGIRSNGSALYLDEVTITWGGSVVPPTPVSVTGVTLSKTAAELEEGKTLSLTATVAPSDATNKTVTWSTSNAAVATVDSNGKVTAVKAGTATITVKTADGNFTATCVVTVKAGSTPPTPSGKVDKITNDNTGLKDQKGYVDSEIKNMPSGAEYLINGYGGQQYIQIRMSDSKSGLITTKSAGSVLSVEITFNEKTTDRKVNIYGSNSAFTSTEDLYKEGATMLGAIGAADASKKLTISGDYKYIGLRSAEGAVYIDQIAIEWGDFEEKATTTLSISPKTAEVEVGKTVALTVTRDGNDALTWSTSDASIATVANGVVTGVKEGTVKIKATANNISDECTVTVKKGTSPDEVPTKTVAEFIAAQGGKCKLTGVVGKIDNAQYGNFNLTDNSGTIYIYGLLTAAGESKKFSELNVAEGDTLTVIAEEYKLYNEKPEVVNAIFVSVKKGQGGGSGEEIPPLPDGVISCEAAVAMAASITDPAEDKATAQGGPVKVRGFVTYAYDANNGKQSAWLSDTKGAKAGVIQGAYLAITEAVAVGDYVELDGTLAKYRKAGKDGAASEVIIEVINGTMSKVSTSGGGGQQGTPLAVNYVEAAYLEDEEGPYWEIFAVKLDMNSFEMDYPLLIMDIDNTSENRLSGEYDIFYAALYTSDNDSIEFVDGKAAIRCTKLVTEDVGAMYHFLVTLHDEAGKEYVYEFEVEVYAYDGMNSTEEETVWIDLEDPVQGIENTEVNTVVEINTPIYTIQGQRVSRETPGVILIQNGRKFMINGL